ncbi:hypothetical protein C1645_788093 [Glomus cerebriforme]|uniref:Uncharacterized protein n=1 Tax=Glomus cerebriforme TaxID=658196 RepID=A0A397SD06_9GLOM|nr:hypothetical protein C1645_788093 [Glomus cerebriforme]
MSTTTASRLPSRLPAKSGKTVNGTSTGQQQKTLSTPSKLQKTNIDVTNKSSPVRSMLPSPKSSISSSITNESKSPTKRNLIAQTAKQTSLLKRKSEDITGRNVRVAPSSDNKKSNIQSPKSITSKITPRKKATSKTQQQSRISMKNSVNSTTPTRKTESRTENIKLLAEIDELRAENKKLQAENKELRQEKGLLTVDVCQMEHRLACEESRVFELEVDVADLRKQCSLLNGKHDQLDRNRDQYQNELEIANNLIMEQAVTMSDQQSLIEELMAQLDEQERVCQDLQNVIDNFKTKHNILDELKDINFAWQLF